MGAALEDRAPGHQTLEHRALDHRAKTENMMKERTLVQTSVII